MCYSSLSIIDFESCQYRIGCIRYWMERDALPLAVVKRGHSNFRVTASFCSQCSDGSQRIDNLGDLCEQWYTRYNATYRVYTQYVFGFGSREGFTGPLSTSVDDIDFKLGHPFLVTSRGGAPSLLCPIIGLRCCNAHSAPFWHHLFFPILAQYM